MKRMPLLVMIVPLLIASAAIAVEMRTMRGAAGETIRGRLEGITADTVTIRREDWRKFDIPLARFSPDEQSRLKNQAASLQATATKINQAVGHELVNLTPLDGREAAGIAAALGLPQESQTQHGSSWRRYGGGNGDEYRLFGAMPYSTALYSDADELVSHISIVFANKGDFGSTAGTGEDHFDGGTKATGRTLADAMEADAETLTTALTLVLGEPSRQRFGERETRRTVTRWDWHGYSFILSHEEGEYVGLAIISTEAADGGGRTARISNTEIRERLAASVQRADNGDVWLTDIPMVNQGPKGYCVPATFERALRTLGVEADMYLLAMVGETKAGGGTSVERLIDNVSSHVRSKGRRTDDDRLRELRIRDVKRRLDEGVPVMWTMESMDAFNEIANANTEARKQPGVDHDARIAEFREQAIKVASEQTAEGRGHLCMIIGYNEETRELAVSDSWGPRYELRWVPIEAAQWVSNDKLFFILP